MASSWSSLSDDEITVDNIAHLSSSTQSDSWVVAACFDRLLKDVPTQRKLLELGLDRSQDALARSKGTLSQTSEGDHLRALTFHFQQEPLDAQVCRMHAVLLDRLDRLNTYAELCKELVLEEGGSEIDEEWEDDPWAEADSEAEPATNTALKEQSILSLPGFLSDDLLQTALLLASQQQFAALYVLTQRHGSHLVQYRFLILDSIPEHSRPSEYLELLPTCDPNTDLEQLKPSKPWRTELDWTETPLVQEALQATASEQLQPAKEYVSGSSEPISAVAMLEWYTRRISTVISLTGMVDVALTLTQHGAASGLAGLDEIGEELSLLSRLVYDAPRIRSEENDYTLESWRTMSPADVIRSYLSQSNPTTVVKDIQRLVIPYLFVLESRAERGGHPDSHLRNRLLYDFIANSPLEIAAAIFEASKPTLPSAQRLITDDEDIARLALACLYGSDSLDEWATMSRIFECLPAWESAVDSEAGDDDEADTTIASLGDFVTPSTTRPQCTPSDLLLFFQPLHASSLSRALDVLDVHLESGEILSRWNVPAKLRWFLQSMNNEVEQRSWAHRMSRRAGGASDEPDSPEEYEWLLEDMLKLSGTGEGGLKGAFGLISREQIISIFFSGLLTSGKFVIAKKLLHASDSKVTLDLEAIENICLSCSREFYDNATSGNYKFGDMNIAYNCLSVPFPSPRIVKEQEFIEATSRICSFNVTSGPGIPISPIEIRLTKDRLSLVSRVLSSNDSAYIHTEVILDLVHKLGYKGDIAAEVKTLAMISDVALQNEDFTRAYEMTDRIVQTVHKLNSDSSATLEAREVCWVACFQLGRQSEFADMQKKLSLLGRALELCPPERMVEILAAWRKLDEQDLDARRKALATRLPADRTSRKRQPVKLTTSFADRLQMHIPPSPLINTPDAAMLASKTFSRVAANLPFSIGRERSASPSSRSSSRMGKDGEERIHASRVLQKGIGWLLGAEEG